MSTLFELLPTKMISKTYINGIKIDYEEYLVELLNSSRYFKSLSNGANYERILSQANSEADVVANGYELDFKLLVHKDFVNAKLKSLPNVDYSNIKSGFVCVNEKPKNSRDLTQTQANSLFISFLQILAQLTKEQIRNIEYDKDSSLYNTIKMVKTKKNLLIFLPCIVNIRESLIPQIITRFFSGLFSLRDNINKDTFFTLLGVDKYFYILKYYSGKFVCIDKVHMVFTSSFRNIYRLTYFLEYS